MQIPLRSSYNINYKIMIKLNKKTEQNLYSKLVVTIFLLTIASSTFAEVPIYRNEATDAGINHEVNFPLSPLLQGFGAGAAWIDFDNDGDDDVAFSNPHAAPANLSQSWFYQNNGDGTFTDITALSFGDTGFGKGKISMGVFVADYNGDGFDDILLLNGSRTSKGKKTDQNQFYRNNGDDTFTETSFQTGIIETDGPRWSFAAAFGDVDNDLDLDLYIGNYVAINGESGCSENYFYRNNGNGTFSEQAELLGVADGGCTLAATFTDVDNDGDLDLWVVNDFGQSFHTNELYRNDGLDIDGNPIFTPSAFDMNLDAAIFGMGIATGDINNDGNLDYYISNLGANVLHKNNDDGTFIDIALSGGVDDEFIDNTEVMSASWGVAFIDADNDGFQDLYVANGWVGILSGGFLTPNPNRLYMNNGDETFIDVTHLSGMDVVSNSTDRGLAVADYDNDGDMDILVSGPGNSIYDKDTSRIVTTPAHPKLLNNITNNGANWIKLNLEGKNPNHRAIGARITLKSVSSDGSVRSQHREVQSGSSHVSGNEIRPHFGLGDHDEVQSIVVTWPSGCVSEINSPGVNQIVTISEKDCVTSIDDSDVD